MSWEDPDSDFPIPWPKFRRECRKLLGQPGAYNLSPKTAERAAKKTISDIESAVRTQRSVERDQAVGKVGPGRQKEKELRRRFRRLAKAAREASKALTRLRNRKDEITPAFAEQFTDRLIDSQSGEVELRKSADLDEAWEKARIGAELCASAATLPPGQPAKEGLGNLFLQIRGLWQDYKGCGPAVSWNRKAKARAGGFYQLCVLCAAQMGASKNEGDGVLRNALAQWRARQAHLIDLKDLPERFVRTGIPAAKVKETVQGLQDRLTIPPGSPGHVGRDEGIFRGPGPAIRVDYEIFKQRYLFPAARMSIHHQAQKS
jgi:hypothetical protein